MTEYEKIYEDIADRPGGPYIRLLTLLPGESGLEDMKAQKPEEDWPQKWDDDIGGFVGIKPDDWDARPPVESDLEVELSAHPLSACPEYEALSYTWGKPTDYQFNIKCNGHNFVSLRQMHNALHALRLPDRPRVLWIDAICINQSQYSDKNCQLPLMQHIYRNAKRTVIWLGTEDENNHAPAFDHAKASGDMPPSDLEDFAPSFEKFLTLNLETLAANPEELWQDHPEVIPTWEHRIDLIKEAALRVQAEWAARETPPPADFKNAIQALTDEFVENSSMPKFLGAAGKFLLTRPSYRNTVRQGLFMMDEKSTWRGTIANLLSREWWSRVWIIQEVCLSADIVMLCGHTTLDIDILFLGMVLYSIFSTNPIFRGQIMSAWTLGQVMEYRALHREAGRRPLPGFLHLLTEFRLSDATNPRDHVYALLGLLPPDELAALDQTDYKPDYSKDVVWCYTETAKAVCRAGSNLDILSISRPPARVAAAKSNAGLLPSWVPDWSMRVHIRSPTHSIGLQRAGDAAPIFSACGACHAWVPQTRGDGELVISGYVADCVTEIVAFTLPQMGDFMETFMKTMMDEDNEEAMNKALDSMKGMLSLTTDIFGMLGSIITGLVEWDEFAMSRGTSYVTGEDMKQVACAVRCYGNLPGGLHVAMGAFNEYTKTFWWARKMYNLLSPPASSTVVTPLSSSSSATKSKSSPLSFFQRKKSKESEPTEKGEEKGDLEKDTETPAEKAEQSKWSKNLMSMAGPKAKDAKKMAKFNAMQSYSVGRKLAWTEKGYLALVHADAGLGDKIVLCKGSKLPIVVRETGVPNRWQLLEGCYVHGIMGGEAWQEERCEEMTLI